MKLRLVLTDARRRPIAYHGVVAVAAPARWGIGPSMGGAGMQIQIRDALQDLTSDEIREAVRLLRAERGLAETARFARVELLEPPKELFLTRPAAEIERLAFAVLYDKASRQTFEAVVSLDAGAVREWRSVPGVQPPYIGEEYGPVEEAIKASPLFREAMARRGVVDMALVQVDPWSAGYYGAEAEIGRRLTRAYAWVRQSPTDNAYAHPVEGVVVLLDIDTLEVLGVEDHGVTPLPQAAGNYSPAAVGALRPDLKPLEIVQPEGPSFEIDGSLVRWQKWRFRVGFTAREGLVLHTVGYEDGGRMRPILHRASIAEMVVPYGDPSPTHDRKNAFDAGEYNLGACANSLELGCDCLGHIHYFDAVLVDGAGEPSTIKNAICLHEEDHGLLWKHVERRSGSSEARRSRRLVVSFIATIGNYEYGFYWQFYQDGSIQFEVVQTGIMVTGAVPPGVTPAHGQLLNRDGLYAPIHQHFFSVRLDLDVDGTINRLVEVNTEAAPPGPDNPRGNAFRAVPTPLASESAAQRIIDPLAARHWRVINPGVLNAVGEPVAYALIPGANVLPFAQPDAWVLRRAGFLTKHLWATPYAPGERYAAGDYPKQSTADAGLAAWTRADRPLDGADLVLWYTLGAHHAPRLEDWPVMPAHHVGFTLKPVGFFDRNPALDVPPPLHANGQRRALPGPRARAVRSRGR
jgi:primary-amine oxidase